MPTVSKPPRQPQTEHVKEHEPVRDVVVRPRKPKMEELEHRLNPGNGWSV
jgi:hypothetical protein